MTTLNTILKEIKDVPVERLEEVYQFVHSLNRKHSVLDTMRRKKILSFAGAFSDMSKDDYEDFLNQTKKTRDSIFDRYSEL